MSYSPWGCTELDTTEATAQHSTAHPYRNGKFGCKHVCGLAVPWLFSGKESACSTGDAGALGSVLGLGRHPGGGHGNPLQYSCLENHMDRRAWWTTVHRSQRVGHD